MLKRRAHPCRYGLVYPGVGWILFRNKSYLPESLVFHDNYLGTGERHAAGVAMRRAVCPVAFLPQCVEKLRNVL